jgi:hypothetical protein
VAGLGLDAAQREHEAARRVAPVGAQRHGAGDVEGADDAAGRADRILSRRFRPTSVLCTSSRPSCSGAPTWSVNSSGAAPVPPSPPSTTMKSGVMPVASMALQIANHSQGWPMQSLKPVGLPPESSRSRATNCSSSSGVPKALWRRARRSPRPPARRAPRRSRRHLGAGQHAAVAGLGALGELHLDQLDLRVGRQGGELVRVEAAGLVAAAEVARGDLPDQVAAVLAVVAADRASPVSCMKPPRRAPAFSARMALADSAPKLIAEMLNTLAL